jgi:proteasome accessory factor A
VRLSNGRELSALDVQWEYLERTMRYSRTTGFPPEVDRAVQMWEHLLAGLEKDPMTLSREIDWVAKLHLIERYRDRHDLPISSSRLAMIDLSYHEVAKDRGLYHVLERKGLMERIVTDALIDKAMIEPPATTRARLRGAFIKKAKTRQRDFTVDWVHLKINDQAQRTVLCKDPFKATDERVDKLIDSL